jgi:hypothetical protein
LYSGTFSGIACCASAADDDWVSTLPPICCRPLPVVPLHAASASSDVRAWSPAVPRHSASVLFAVADKLVSNSDICWPSVAHASDSVAASLGCAASTASFSSWWLYACTLVCGISGRSRVFTSVDAGSGEPGGALDEPDAGGTVPG